MKRESNKKTYKEYAEKKMTPSPCFKNTVFAFLGGGSICLLGQLLQTLYTRFCQEDTAYLLASITLIFLAILLTGFGVFDKIASLLGAGTLVPITGFANAMSSPAIDAKSEGFILGVGAKTFTVAGPVILYGTVASVLYGCIYYICSLVIQKA
jgi:stage V sporulation protein AC